MNTFVQAAPIGQEDRRAKTILPFIASTLSVVSGAALAFYAYNLLGSPDVIGKLIGAWNMVVVLAYLWLAYALVKRQERAYSAGLFLSLGNVAFVFGQIILWNNLGWVAGLSDEERMMMLGAAPFIFMATDALLAVGLYLSFRDLVHPMLPEEVPESDVLLKRLDETEQQAGTDDPLLTFLGQSSKTAGALVARRPAPLTQAEKAQFLDVRRRFLAEMKSTARGGAEINVAEDSVVYDLVVKPLTSYFRSEADAKKEYQRFVFYPFLSRPLQLEQFRRSNCNVIAIAAAPDVLVSAENGMHGRVNLYVLRDRVRITGRWARATAFEKFVANSYGLTFDEHKRSK